LAAFRFDQAKGETGGAFAMKSTMNWRLTVSVGSIGRVVRIVYGLGPDRMALKIGG
jgi:hypothetical protein